MALFSRRKKSDADAAPVEGIEPGEQPVDPATEPGPAAAPDAPAEAAPEVSISLSAFRGVGAAEPAAPAASAPGASAPGASAPGASAPQGEPIPPRRQVPAEAPAPTETVPGLRDNVLLKEALASLSVPPSGPELMNVVRQLLQGHVFLRVQGDARELLSQGKSLPLSVASLGDKRYMLVYSGGAALRDSVQADGNAKTSAMGQPVLAVLRHALDGDYEGIIVDNNSGPARAVLPRGVLERAIKDAEETLRIKTLLAAPRTEATASEVVAALAEAPLWIAVKRDGDAGAIGVAETRTSDGERYLEVFSHPLEAVALGRGDASAPITSTQLATALAKDPQLTGLLVNPGGPWIRLDRGQLAPFLALAG